MAGLARQVGTPKLAMIRTPGTDALGSASASGTQRFRITRHFTRPNTEMVLGNLRGITGGWAYSFETVKAGFFDRGAVMGKLSDIQAKVYAKFGAYVRRRASTSIRRRNRSSNPGSPPFAHGDLLKKNIFYSWDFFTRSVTIGPRWFRTAAQARMNIRSNNMFSTVPAVLEHGGEASVHKKSRRAARPFMGPAFKYEYDNNLGRFWQEQRQTPFTP